MGVVYVSEVSDFVLFHSLIYHPTHIYSVSTICKTLYAKQVSANILVHVMDEVFALMRTRVS